MPRNTQSSRGGSRKRSNNNNPEGYNQYNSGWMDTARERPVATAGLAAAAVGAGVFLWSRRSQISEQLSNLSDQIGEFTSGNRSEEFETAGGGSSGSWAGGGSGGSSGGSTGQFSGSGAEGAIGGSSGMGSSSGSSGSIGGKSGKSGSNRSRS